MKVLIDIPNKAVEAVKAVMLAQCEKAEQEEETVQTFDNLLKAEEPILLDIDKLKASFDGDPDKGVLLQKLTELYSVIIMLVIIINDLDVLKED